MRGLRDYDVVLIGTGSGMNVLAPMLEANPTLRAAVVDKDEPGGICLTRGCIPTKILLHSADVLRLVRSAHRFGVDASLKGADFGRVMERMRRMIGEDIDQIRRGLSSAPNIDYYHATAEFIGPHALRVGDEEIHSELILLCLGSRPMVPSIKGLMEVPHHTSDSILGLRRLPASVGIIGGGYIAAEYGHFFSAMGSRVTILGRNPRILPREEPEVSELIARVMRGYLNLLTNHEVVEVGRGLMGKKTITAVDRASGRRTSVAVDEILVASGRAPNSDIIHPERSGVATDAGGWIAVNEYLETSAPGIWAFGDCIGGHLFKHVANYESMVVYQNAVLGRRIKVDYRAVPHAVFTSPEVASVGMREAEALAALGEGRVMVGFARYADTAKGAAMEAEGFVKIVAEEGTEKLLGAHIVGPQASVLIQELVTLMHTREGTLVPVKAGMHIHPALSEVVERAAASLMPPAHYHHLISHGI
ncbi:MAG: dihydrolipoyl dehydrogenase [Thermoplasmatota archaeon]